MSKKGGPDTVAILEIILTRALREGMRRASGCNSHGVCVGQERGRKLRRDLLSRRV